MLAFLRSLAGEFPFESFPVKTHLQHQLELLNYTTNLKKAFNSVMGEFNIDQGLSTFMVNIRNNTSITMNGKIAGRSTSVQVRIRITMTTQVLPRQTQAQQSPTRTLNASTKHRHFNTKQLHSAQNQRQHLLSEKKQGIQCERWAPNLLPTPRNRHDWRKIPLSSFLHPPPNGQASQGSDDDDYYDLDRARWGSDRKDKQVNEANVAVELLSEGKFLAYQ
ncbi:hypothetical protein DPMN_106783 [Dreissena polymorpha]|uniref:Uncharacterized protein n=1 Tax=Dreissena polymorpha TaxID=45954 RepID=A0A9D4QIZ3_DREPO|nr:hypothetical protein DPMN_106783 [Dreissena polymorpha]